MNRNVLLTNTTVANEDNTSLNTANEKIDNHTSSGSATDNIVIPDECKNDFVKAMKIGYYKEFYKQGLITAEQLEQLIKMQDKKPADIAA